MSIIASTNPTCVCACLTVATTAWSRQVRRWSTRRSSAPRPQTRSRLNYTSRKSRRTTGTSSALARAGRCRPYGLYLSMAPICVAGAGGGRTCCRRVGVDCCCVRSADTACVSSPRTVVPPSANMHLIHGLNLLHLLVENRLAEFHCEVRARLRTCRTAWLCRFSTADGVRRRGGLRNPFALVVWCGMAWHCTVGAH